MGFFSSLFSRGGRCAVQSSPSASPCEQADVYKDLRDRVLQLTPRDLNLSAQASEPIAVLMETGFPEAVATLVCVQDGSASLYFSHGGGIIGAGEHEAVRSAAMSFVQLAPEFTSQMRQTDAFPLPHEGSVRFYVVTAGGVRTIEAAEDALGEMRHTLSPLFHKGHEVIAAMRELAPD